MKQLLPVLCALQLLSYAALAQEQNVNPHNNVNDNISQLRSAGNINIVAPTGPNGPGGNVFSAVVNNNVINSRLRTNPGGPNVQGFTSSLIPVQRITRPATNKPKRTVTAGTNKIKPKPKVVAAAPTNTRRPQTRRNMAAPVPIRRVTRPAAQVVVSPAQTPPVPVQEPIQVVVNDPVLQINNPSVQVQVMNNDAIVQTAIIAPASGAISAPAMRNSASSGGSVSGGRSNRSRSKKHSRFSYSAHKKLNKLFAQSRKGKFDPVKCFVWN